MPGSEGPDLLPVVLHHRFRIDIRSKARNFHYGHRHQRRRGIKQMDFAVNQAGQLLGITEQANVHEAGIAVRAVRQVQGHQNAGAFRPGRGLVTLLPS